MPQTGFICPKSGGETLPEYCFKDCLEPCHPLPVIGAMVKNRGTEDGVYSVTEIIKPYQSIFLARHNDYYVTPESMLYMLNGSAIHAVLEWGGKHLDDTHVSEGKNSVELTLPNGKVTLRGTFDYYDSARKTLWDFKNAKAYTVKKIKNAAKDGSGWDEDYFTQLNIYRAYFCPEAEKLKLWMFVSGWSRREKDLEPVEQINVPVLPIEEVKRWVEFRLNNILEHENGGEIPECPAKDRWAGANGVPMRCMEYCAVNKYCPTHKRYLGSKP